MDGIDGLVASNLICLLIMRSNLGDSSYITLVALLLGFLIFNWSPAKIFMGDSGSTFLGGSLVYALISLDDIYQIMGLHIASLPLILDAIICLIIRFLNSENIFQAHRKHLYQRLNQAGMSHNKVSSIYLIATVSLSLSYLLVNIQFQIIVFIFIFILAYIMDKKIAEPFK